MKKRLCRVVNGTVFWPLTGQSCSRYVFSGDRWGKDHVHFFIQSYSPTQTIKIVKSITVKEVFARCLEVKKQLWGRNSWAVGYYVATLSEHGNEEVIANYVKNQGNEYKKLFQNKVPEGQLRIFDYM